MPFRFLLVLENGEPPDPAVLVTAVPNRDVGIVRDLVRYRVLGVEPRELEHDGVMVNGIFTVERIGGA